MERWRERWRYDTRLRWLCWTVVYGVVLYGSAWLSAAPLLRFGLPVLAAFLIGVHFKDPWWGWGPPTACLVFGLVTLLGIPLGPPPPPQPHDPTRVPSAISDAYAPFFHGVLFFASIVGCALLGAIGYAGVQFGYRRDDTAAIRDDR